MTTDRYASEGVLAGLGGELAVSGTATPVSVATGAAYVAGFFYKSDATNTFAITTPSSGTTGHRVILRADISGNTVRAALLSSRDGTSSAPSLTQTAGQQWEISLATLTITTGGVITVTDARDYSHQLAALLYRRSGNSSTDWSSQGSTTYIPGGMKIQGGVATVVFDDDNDSDTKTITFPSVFSGKPLIFVTNISAAVTQARDSNINVYGQGTSSFQLRGRRVNGSWDGTVSVQWLAIGPE